MSLGRTNPTYRDWLGRTEQRWQPFRRALRSRTQDDFDRLFERAATHAGAAGYLNAAEPEHVMLLSMLLAQERALQELAARLHDVEVRLHDVEARLNDVESCNRIELSGGGATERPGDGV